MAAKKRKASGGRPFKWPWLETKVGGSFVITCWGGIRSCRSAVSRMARLHDVRYVIYKHPDENKFRLRRVK
jgi:hypothetical protein